MDNGDNGVIPRYSFFLLNLIVIMRSGTDKIYSSLMDQYMYQRYANDVLGNVSQKTSSQPCVNESNTATIKIQDMTSQLSLYVSLVENGLAVAPCLFLGAYSDLISRKLLLFLPTFVGSVKAMVIVAVVYWDLDLNWLYLGYTLSGLGGGMAGSMVGAYLYLTDITSRDSQRTVSMNLLQCLKGFMSGVLYYVTGQMIESTGYLLLVLIAAFLLWSSLGLIFLLPETKPQCVSGDWSLMACYRTLALPFTKAQQHPVVKKIVILAVVALFANRCALFGQTKVRNFYVMNFPFCWDAVKIGWFLSAQDIASNLLAMVGVPLSYRCLPGMWLAILGTVSLMAGLIMYDLASTDLEIYMILGLSIGTYWPFGLLRGETSRLLDCSSQGSLFATMSVFESISFLGGTPMLLLYQVTVGMYSGFTFLALNGLHLVALILLCVSQFYWLRYSREISSNEIVWNHYGSVTPSKSTMKQNLSTQEINKGTLILNNTINQLGNIDSEQHNKSIREH